MARSFKDFLLDLLPPWLRDPAGEAWPRSTGDAMDDILARARAGVRDHLPIATPSYTPPADALDAIGAERQLPRAVGEGDADYMARLRGSFDAWASSGTALGLLTALKALGYPTARVMIIRRLMYSLDGSGNLVITGLPTGFGIGSWMVRATRTFWSEFQVLFASDELPSIATGAPSDWATALPAANSDEMAALIATVKRWRPADARCAGIIAVTAGQCWGYPFDNWEDDAGDLYGGDSLTLYQVD